MGAYRNIKKTVRNLGNHPGSEPINMKIIQVWLGHSNMSTTADIYSHLDANAKSEAGRAIESVLSINTEDTM